MLGGIAYPGTGRNEEMVVMQDWTQRCKQEGEYPYGDYTRRKYRHRDLLLDDETIEGVNGNG